MSLLFPFVFPLFNSIVTPTTLTGHLVSKGLSVSQNASSDSFNFFEDLCFHKISQDENLLLQSCNEKEDVSNNHQ